MTDIFDIEDSGKAVATLVATPAGGVALVSVPASLLHPGQCEEQERRHQWFLYKIRSAVRHWVLLQTCVFGVVVFVVEKPSPDLCSTHMFPTHNDALAVGLVW